MRLSLRPASALALAGLVVSMSLVPQGCGGRSASVENEMNFFEGSQIKGLDPIQANDLYSHRMVAQMYEGLMQYSFLERPYKAEPALADGMPAVSEDGKVYTFKIKKGVRFADDKCFQDGKGREITAEDFIYSWKRLADIKNLSEGWWVFDGRIEGLDEFREYTKSVEDATKVDYSRPVAGLKALDRHTLQVNLKKPFPQLLFILCMGFTRVVPKEAVDLYGKEFLNHPVGSGPYMLKSWVKGSKLVLEKNPNFREEYYPTVGEESDKTEGRLADAGKRVPFIDRINVHIIIEDQPRWLKFMRGDLDVIAPPKDNYDAALPGGRMGPELQKMGIVNFKMPRLDVVYNAFNMEDPVLGLPGGAKALALRRAISLALDRDKFVELMYNGRALHAKGPIPPGLDGYEPEWDNPYAKHDPERARQILKEAFPDGKIPTLVYEASSGSTARQLAEFIQKNYQNVGIKMEINTNTWPELDKKVRTKRAQIYGMAWQADYPDAENFLMLFYGPNESPGPNGSNYKNPQFDELFAKASTMQPGPERTELYKKLARMVADDAPWSFEVHRLADTLIHPWLKNYKPHDPGHGFFKYYRIDQEEKKRRLGFNG